MSEPRTEAGRAFLASIDGRTTLHDIRMAVLAIEAEAVRDDEPVRLREAFDVVSGYVLTASWPTGSPMEDHRHEALAALDDLTDVLHLAAGGVTDEKVRGLREGTANGVSGGSPDVLNEVPDGPVSAARGTGGPRGDRLPAQEDRGDSDAGGGTPARRDGAVGGEANESGASTGDDGDLLEREDGSSLDPELLARAITRAGGVDFKPGTSIAGIIAEYTTLVGGPGHRSDNRSGSLAALPDEPVGGLLEDAWKAAEAALPEGWALTVGRIVTVAHGTVYWAGAGPDEDDLGTMLGGKDTPAEALRELAARLAASPTFDRWTDEHGDPEGADRAIDRAMGIEG